MTVGWNQFKVSFDGIDTVNYSVDGNVIASQGAAITSQDPSVADFTTAYLENYNFFGNGNLPSSGVYNAYWANVTATTSPVPEPSSLAMAGLGLLSLAGINRFRRERA